MLKLLIFFGSEPALAYLRAPRARHRRCHLAAAIAVVWEDWGQIEHPVQPLSPAPKCRASLARFLGLIIIIFIIHHPVQCLRKIDFMHGHRIQLRMS